MTADPEGLLRYLRKNENPFRGTNDQYHDELLEEIRACPARIGIPHTESFFEEVALIKDKILVGMTDIIIIDSFGSLYTVEAKVIRGSENRNNKHAIRKGINKQLVRAHLFFRENYGFLSQMVGVYAVAGSARLYCYQLSSLHDDSLERQVHES